MRRGAKPSITAPRDFAETIGFFSEIMPATLKAAINRKIISDRKALRANKIFAILTKFINVFHRSRISNTKGERQKAVLAEVTAYFQENFVAGLLSVETQLTSNNFIKLINELLKAYPGITIVAYRLSQDLLKGFFLQRGAISKKKDQIGGTNTEAGGTFNSLAGGILEKRLQDN